MEEIRRAWTAVNPGPAVLTTRPLSEVPLPDTRVPPRGMDIDALARERAALLDELARLGPFRRGTLVTRWRRCGKPRCVCARDDHPGHGPQHLLVRAGPDGRTRSTNIRPGPALTRLRAQVEAWRRFRAITARLAGIGEALCYNPRPDPKIRTTPRS